MRKELSKYWFVWWTMAKLSILASLSTRGSAIMFIIGKFIRFSLFVYFLLILGENVEEIAGYDFSAMLLFYLVFNLFDIFGQFFFRGIYRFREQVVSGEFDFRLIKPLSPLFQALTRYTDVLDLPLLVIIVGALIFQMINLPSIGFGLLFLFISASMSGIILVISIHVIIAALGVLTTEVDHTIMIYRDLSLMARFPVDIYANNIKAILTFVVPIALIFTYPAKVLLGFINPLNIVVVFVGSLLFSFLSYRLWRYSLTKYSSASS